MRPQDIPRIRSRNLRLDGGEPASAAEVVAWHGALQAQEYVPAQWSITQRSTRLTRGDVERAVAEGSIIRTHALRPTWHFVARDDARLVLGLTGPRVRRAVASRYDRLGLDVRTRDRAQRLIAKALGTGGELTRAELSDVLRRSRIDVEGQRLPHLLMHCELELAICSGARRGNDHTYALFDERVPPGPSADPAAATRTLVERYLRSHGPAAVADVRWWASLPSAEVRAALDDLGDDVRSETIDGVELWSAEPVAGDRSRPEVRLLETFDEYVVGYTRSRFFGDPEAEASLAAWRGRSPLRNVVTRGGAILGLWRRTRTGARLTVEVGTHRPLSAEALRSLRAEVERLARFHDVTGALHVAPMDGPGGGRAKRGLSVSAPR